MQVKILHKGKTGALMMNIVEVTLDSAYPTNGEPLTPGQMGMSSVVAIPSTFAAGYAFEYDMANKKLKAFYSNSDAADGPLVEVPNDTSLDAVKVTLVVHGYN